MNALLTSAVALGLVLAVSGCEAAARDTDEGDDPGAVAVSDPGPAFDGADWDSWAGVYSDVRPATDEDVAELRARVAERNATTWTATDAESGAEIVYTPTHVRASWGYVDLHLDPRAQDDLPAEFTVCDEAACHGIDLLDEDSVEDQRAIDAIAALPPTGLSVQVLLETQLMDDEDVEGVLDEGVMSVATVESPIGPLDCLVHVPRQRQVAGLEGAALLLPSPHTDDGFTSYCIDQRGLVLLGPHERSVIVRYTSWRAGVDPGATELVPAEGGPDPAPVDPTGDYDGVPWGTWDGVYRDVRPATEADVAAVRERILTRNATSWTGVVDQWGFTLSVTPTHVRADFGEGVELHLDPNREPYVLCAEGDCLRIGPDAEVEGPHVTNNFLDSMTFVTQSLVYWQRRDGAARLVDPMVAATVDSPVGPLDCLVRGQSQEDLDDLDGASAVPDLDGSPVVGPRSAPLCVDQRGLVTRTEDVMTPLIVYSSWREGVEGDIETYPAPVVDYNDR